MIKEISFKNNLGQTLRGFVNIPRKYDTAIIILHGFPGSSSHRVKKLSKMLSLLGYLSMGFDFSGTDKSDGKFEDKLMSQEVKEIKYAIDYIKNNYSVKKIILYGHSTGAVDAALYAHKDKRISKLILSGGLVDLKNSAKYDFNEKQISDFKNKGYITYYRSNHWTHRKKLKKAFYNEYFTLDVVKTLKKYKRPILVIHGDKDDVVPIANGYQVFKTANQPKKMVVIKNCNHDFSKLMNKIRLVYEINKFAKK